MLIPPIDPGHPSLITDKANEQMPMRHTTTLKLHAGDPGGVNVPQLAYKGIVEPIKGILGGFPADLGPPREARIVRIPERQSSIPVPISHAI